MAAANASMQIHQRSAVRPFQSKGRSLTVVCNARQQASPFTATVLASVASIALLYGGPAMADSDENLTPFQRRQLENERRRELLRQTREAAESKLEAAADPAPAVEADDSAEDANAERRATMERSKEDMKRNLLKNYEDQAAKSFKPPEALFEAKDTAPPTMPAFSMPSMRSFTAPSMPSMPSFSMPSFGKDDDEVAEEAEPAPIVAEKEVAKPAPVVVAPPPPPPPAPVRPPPPPPPVYKAEVKPTPVAEKPAPPKAEVKEVKQESAAVSKKRQGPLPLWLAEFLVFGLYAAIFASVTKYNKQASAAGAAISKVVKNLAAKANLV